MYQKFDLGLRSENIEFFKCLTSKENVKKEICDFQYSIF